MSITYLEKRRSEDNQMRFYAIMVTRTLFGPWAMILEWDRIGQAGTVRESWFDGESAAEEVKRQLLRQKQRNGYQVLECDPGR